MRLIAKDAQIINCPNAEGLTSLHLASHQHGNVELIAHLLDHGATIDQGVRSAFADPIVLSMTALHLACRKGHTRVVHLLLERGADPTIFTDPGLTPLMEACKTGSVGCVRRMLSHDVAKTTIDYQSDQGLTALHLASSGGYGEVVKVLLEAGANPTLRYQDSDTAIAMAEGRGHHDCVALLHVSVFNLWLIDRFRRSIPLC